MASIFVLTPAALVAYVSYKLLTTPSRPKYGPDVQARWKRETMGWRHEGERTGEWRDQDIIIPPMTEQEVDEVMAYYEKMEWKG